MSFTIQDPVSGLFWTTGIFGRVQLGANPNVYTRVGSRITNTITGNYVNHSADIIHEGGATEDFEFGDDGVITTQGKAIVGGEYIHIMEGEPTKWVFTPVLRAAALIAESMKEPEESSESEDDDISIQ